MKSRFKPYVTIIIAIITIASAWLIYHRMQRKSGLQKEQEINKGLSGHYKKRFYNKPNQLLNDMDYIIKHAAEIKAIFRSGLINRCFMQRLMLVVTGINQCRYCSFGHSRSAIREGMDSLQVHELLKSDLSQADPDELTALEFAMHYAESDANPDPEAVTELEDVYGTDMACHIFMILHMITLGNKIGNTFDALSNRIMGAPAKESSLGSELATLMLFAASILPYGIALVFQMALAQVSESTHSKMLVLQQ